MIWEEPVTDRRCTPLGRGERQRLEVVFALCEQGVEPEERRRRVPTEGDGVVLYFSGRERLEQSPDDEP